MFIPPTAQQLGAKVDKQINITTLEIA